MLETFSQKDEAQCAEAGDGLTQKDRQFIWGNRALDSMECGNDSVLEAHEISLLIIPIFSVNYAVKL